MSQTPKTLPPGSYAWCGDCDWKDDSIHCEANGRLHSNALQHVVHVWEQDVCGDPLIDSFGRTHNCEREPGHDGAHRCSAHNIETATEW